MEELLSALATKLQSKRCAGCAICRLQRTSMEVWIVTANGIGDFLNLFSEVFFFLFGYKDRNVLQICLHALHLLFLYTYSKALKLSIRISKYFILLLPRVCIFSLYGLTASISNLLYLYMYTEDYTTFIVLFHPLH